MPLTELNHYFVRANNVQATKDFYCKALDLEEMPRPDFPFPGYWLGARGQNLGAHGPARRTQCRALLSRHAQGRGDRQLRRSLTAPVGYVFQAMKFELDGQAVGSRSSTWNRSNCGSARAQ